jgi:serine/threonine protein kinase
MKAGKEVVPDE